MPCISGFGTPRLAARVGASWFRTGFTLGEAKHRFNHLARRGRTPTTLDPAPARRKALPLVYLRRMSDSPDLVIRGATVLDGTGAQPAVADVAVKDARIVGVGEVDGRGGVEVDGRGLCLSPGFVDVHTHDDGAVLWEPTIPAKVLQGVTSVVVGNCGWSPAPSRPVEGGLVPGFATHAAYLAHLDAEPASVNVSSLTGHNTIRTAVIGFSDTRAPTGGEVAEMEAAVDEGMQAGAVGFSTGLAYEPGRFAETAEVIALARRAAAAGGLYTTHMRDEAGGLLDSVAEAIRVGEEAGLPVQISHHKAAGRENWGRVRDSIAMIEAARERGLDVMADQYPYTRGSTILQQVVAAGGLEGPSPFGHVMPEALLLASAPKHPEWEGRTLAEIAAAEGVDARTMADRIVASESVGALVVLDMMDEDDVCLVMAHPTTMIGSDGVPGGSRPHPRLHHTFPRVLARYVREKGVLDLPTAIHRMTGMPAARFGLADRGVLRTGAFADMVLFDAATIADTGTYDNPMTVPDGIDGVWVNGRRVAADGVHSGDRPGRTLRRS